MLLNIGWPWPVLNGICGVGPLFLKNGFWEEFMLPWTEGMGNTGCFWYIWMFWKCWGLPLTCGLEVVTDAGDFDCKCYEDFDWVIGLWETNWFWDKAEEVKFVGETKVVGWFLFGID